VNWLRYASAIAAVAATFGAPGAALAEDYPTRPIRLVVVTAAGGLMDVAARVTAEYVGKALGQSIVIENRPGGGGNLGAEAIAKAPPDGYTIGLIQLGNVAINPHIYADMTFDPLNDLVPVAPVTTSAILVVANAKLAANDLRELIALAKQSPGKLNYGSGGPGTAPHLAGEMFKGLAGVDILHVPYRGVGPAVNDLVGGHIQLTFAGWGAVRGLVEAGLAKVWLSHNGSRRFLSCQRRPRPVCRSMNSPHGLGSSPRKGRQRS
jgi:tripartite-type tricarboxylate transporter receptor subunit TctC